MNKKNALVIFLVLLFFAGIIALTQELDDDSAESEMLDEEIEFFLTVKEPTRWFRSNKGGMALEEIQTKFIALRQEYALSIDWVERDELPDYLLSYYKNEFLTEIRVLHKYGREIRKQWIFRNIDGVTQVNASLDAPGLEKSLKGFIELFNEKGNIITEYRFFEDGGINRINFEYNEEMLVNSSFFIWEDGETYAKAFTDFYRYNRSFTLRAIERVFYRDMEIGKTGSPERISFPRNIMNDVKETVFIGERINLYPEYFGDVFIFDESKLIFQTDSRGRVLSQTLYDEDGELIWVINNTWEGNRIVSSVKTEGKIILTAEYRYNSSGDMIMERNLRDGELERVVRSDGNLDIEELYLNNIIVLRAVWEEGMKISETRIEN